MGTFVVGCMLVALELSRCTAVDHTDESNKYPRRRGCRFQVLGLHLPVMKLCLASVSCVIENRLESEDNELERRLLRGRRSSSSSSSISGRSVSEPAPSGGRPPPIPAPPLTALVGMQTTPITRPGTSGSHLQQATDTAEDLPLSHTWHGGRANSAARQDTSTNGGRGGGGSNLFGVHAGSRANLLKPPSRRWGTGKGFRAVDSSDGLDAVREDVRVGMRSSANTGMGTPTKSVKFTLGRKRTENEGLSSSAPTAGSTGGVTTATGGTASSQSAAAGGGGQAARGGGQAADPRAAVMNVTVQTRLWAEYFNNTLRCWEALLDPFR